MPICPSRRPLALLATLLAAALASSTGCGGSGTPADTAACVPVDDGRECTLDHCVGGLPVSEPKDLGTTCTQSGGSLCDGHGACVAPACGDQVVSAGEACDDGNAVSGDGCDANCTVSGCGNGVPTAGEACDDGNAVSGDGCDANCTVTGCGNGVLSGVEACDDANLVSGDGCDANCTATACGNGVVTAGEGCDDGNTSAGDGCSPTCQVECGDGVRQGSEACDGQDLGGQTCTSQGFIGGTLGCTAACQVDTSACQSAPPCGNGSLDAGEACDDQNTSDGDGCSSTCRVEPGSVCTGAPSACTVVEWRCDDGQDNDHDGSTDAADGDCALPAYFPPCGAGAALLVLSAPGLPAHLEGFDIMVNRTFRLDVPGTAARASFVVDVSYFFGAELFMQLNKGSTTAVMASYVGFGADYSDTVFDNTCPVAIGSGASPFRGCYLPQQFIPSNVPVAGPWTFSISSKSLSPPPEGQVNSIKLAVCATSP